MKKITLVSFLFLVNISVVLSQQIINGLIVDKNGETMIGVSVLVKGTTVGTISDVNGKFSIKVGTPTDILQFSYVGYINQSIPIGNQKNIKVVMAEKSKDLEEVIVVGYGSQKRSDLTGSVVSVKADEMNSIPTTNVAEMLRGQAAGLVVTQNSARPGGTSDILIRGKKSLTAQSAPLYIVDGVPVDNIDDYNSQDILSVEVLKDASSEAIYGARASNGVILITTKKGVDNKISVDFSSYLSQQVLKRNFDFYNQAEYVNLKRESRRGYDGTFEGGNPVNGVYRGDISLFAKEYPILSNPADSVNWPNYAINTNWEKLFVKPALQQKYDLSIRTGNQNTKIATSFGYFNQKGMIDPASYQRANFRFNGEQKISKNITLGINSNFTYSNRNQEESTLSKYITESSLYNPFDANGNIAMKLQDQSYSPLWNNKNQTNNTITTNLLLNGTIDWEIIKGLKYRLNASYNSRNSQQDLYLNSVHEKGVGVIGLATLDFTNYSNYLLENILTYDYKINSDNKFDVTLVQSSNTISTEETISKGSGFASDELGYNNISSASMSYPVSRTITPKNLLSYMGRIRYNLKEKYLFSVSARMDGSSVFGVNNKWGTFPAASFGWRASEEGFLKDKEWLSNLKLRVSYGSVGNTAIDPYQTQGLASPLSMQFGTLPYIIGYLPGKQLPNPDLKWETTTTLNTGIDFSFLNDRIVGTIEYYDALTKDLIENKSLNPATGFTSQLVNMGNVENKGLEVTLNFVPVKTKDFSWTFSLNFAANQNKIVKLSGQVDANGNPVNDVAHKWFVGHNINAYYDYKFSGIMQIGDTLKTIYQGGPALQPKQGDILVKDIDGNDSINTKDMVILDRDPVWTGGFSSTLKWKNFDFSFDIYTVQGAIRQNLYLFDSNSGGSLSGELNGIKVNYWTLENPSNTAPKPRYSTLSSYKSIQYFSSLSYQDASYVRLRNVSIGYNLKKKWLAALKINSVRIYGSATNLLTFTKYLSYSPEASPGDYPEPQTFTIGLNASF